MVSTDATRDVPAPEGGVPGRRDGVRDGFNRVEGRAKSLFFLPVVDRWSQGHVDVFVGPLRPV